MAPTGEAKLATWPEVRNWLLSIGEQYGDLRVHDPTALALARPRATVAVVQAGGSLPPHFDVLLVAGAADSLSSVLSQLPEHRVQMLPLPCPRDVAERILVESLHSAEAFAGASMADDLLEIGRSLNTERDPGRVLELILEHARRITRADAGSIYLVEDEGATLHFKTSQNDSVQADFSEFTVPVLPTSIVGTTVLRKTTIRVADLYSAAMSMGGEYRFKHDRSFDERFGYQTRSILTSPMITPEGRVLAVIQLINAKRGEGPLRDDDFSQRVRPFTDQDEELALALASQAATALENAYLYQEIQDLFEGFVRASVHAIEQRDPSTSGHSQRVANLTVDLAKAADRSDEPHFASVSFSLEQIKEIEYAGLLHDFGKVGVREEVLVKAKKLYPHQLDMVLARFDHMRTTLRLEHLERTLDGYRHGRGEDPALEAEFKHRLLELEDSLHMVLDANEPSVMPETVGANLRHLANLTFDNTQGETIRLLAQDDVDALLIKRGSLTPAEREEIQSHVTHTYNFLVRIPWGSSLAGVPDIAGKHHEYLDGSGYPSSLPDPQIPLQARMMTVSDIFDALTASDRPYKKAVPVPRALEILEAEAKRGKVDPKVLALFVEAGVYTSGGRR